MTSNRLPLALFAAVSLLLSGCATRVYPAPPPPPPVYAVPPLIDQAQRFGFRAGSEDGARDLFNGFGYHPRRDRRYAETVGYNPGLGPFGPYRNAFRQAYLLGYYEGFRNASGRPGY